MGGGALPCMQFGRVAAGMVKRVISDVCEVARYVFCSAAFTRTGVIGMRSRRAPVAS